MRHALAILLIALAFGASAGALDQAHAQTAVRPRSRPQPPPETPPAPPQTAPQSFPAGPPARLSLPDRFDHAPACRAQCAKARTTCEAVAETCSPEWSACLRRCSAS